MKRLLVASPLALILAVVLPAHAATSTRIPTARRFIPNPATLQAIVVKNTTWASSHVSVETWRRASASSAWQLVHSAGGRAGRNGIKLHRHQGDATTPAGGFRIRWGFGTGPNPNGSGMLWHRFDSNDWWPGDPRDPPTYNTYQTSRPVTAKWRASHAEHLWDFRAAYRYAWVIEFNRPRFGTRPASAPKPALSAGSAIFFHVQGGGATAGCVAVPEARARSISRWLDPAKRPVIVIGEDDWLKRA
jgi:L,D-peptidoglycan transpeptidase YkuD (ErfK/YbiS/YcfS/YnhG family)